MGTAFVGFLRRFAGLAVRLVAILLLVSLLCLVLEWRVTGFARAVASALGLVSMLAPAALVLALLAALGSRSNGAPASSGGGGYVPAPPLAEDWHDDSSARRSRGESGFENQFAPFYSPDRRLWESNPSNGHTGFAQPNAPFGSPDRQSWENQYGQNSW